MFAPKMPKGERLLPSAGTVQAVLYDVWDLGWQKTNYVNDDGSPKIQPKIVLAFEIDERMPEGSKRAGERFAVNKRYTFSFWKNATLRKDVESWIGKTLSDNEAELFDIETLIGKNCLLAISNNESDNGNTYTNIASISPLMKDMQPLMTENKRAVPEWIVKIQEKAVGYPDDYSAKAEQEAQLKSEAKETEAPKETEETIPF